MELPIFPYDTKMVNHRLGIKEEDGFVYYFNYLNPIHCHLKDDMNSFRYITASLIVSKICSVSELSIALGVPKRNLERYTKGLRENGVQHFLKGKHEGGQAHRMTTDKLVEAQELLNEPHNSICGVARKMGVSEGAIRYHINKGNLKKK